MTLIDVQRDLYTAYLMASGVQHDATNRPPSGIPAQHSSPLSFLCVFGTYGFAEHDGYTKCSLSTLQVGVMLPALNKHLQPLVTCLQPTLNPSGIV